MRKIYLILDLALFGILFPFLALSFFTNPSADDFCYAQSVVNFGFLSTQHIFYQTANARYFATFLMSISPLSFGNYELQKIFGLVTILALQGAIYYLVRTVVAKTISFEAKLLISLSVLVLYVLTIPSLAEAFYWMAGSVTYLWGSILLLILLARIIRSQTQKITTFSWIIDIFITVIVIGSNEPLMLIVDLALIGLTSYAFLRKHISKWQLLSMLIVALICTAIIYFAPSTGVRAGSIIADHKHELKFSVLETLNYFPAYISLLFTPLLFSTTLLFEAVTLRLHKLSKFKTKKSLILLILSILASALGIAAIAFTFNWTSGDGPNTRGRNEVYVVFLLGYFFTVYFLTELLWRLRDKQLEKYSKWIKLTLIAAFVIWSANILWTQGDLYKFNLAMTDLTDGTAYNYNLQLETRKDYLVAHKGNDLVQTSLLKYFPTSILFSDLSTNKGAYENTCESDYFGVKAIQGIPN